MTTFLLVHDLGRPERFLKVLTHPNPRSWLVKGAWVLTGFGLMSTAVLAARLAGSSELADGLRWLNLPLAILASGYSAWLFAQCRGRDLWLEHGLFVRLVLRAAALGGGLALLLPRDPAAGVFGPHLVGGLMILTAISLVAESLSHPGHRDGRQAVAVLRQLLSGGPQYWPAASGLLLILGTSLGLPLVPLAATALVLLGAALVLFERAWIQAGQAVPLS